MNEKTNRNFLVTALKLTCSLCFFLALAGCGPAISSSIKHYAGPPFTFADLEAHADQYQGQLVVLGGEIMKVQPQGNGSLLTVNQIPLDAHKQPIKNAPTSGTFVVESDHWLNPDEYAAKSKVTVHGVVKGRLSDLPLVEARQIHLWEISIYKPPLLSYPFYRGN
jgi:starvation-inducible outer membrane lipoprotein